MKLTDILEKVKGKEVALARSAEGKVIDLTKELFSKEDIFDDTWEIMPIFNFMESVTLMGEGKAMKAINSVANIEYFFIDKNVIKYKRFDTEKIVPCIMDLNIIKGFWYQV